MINNNYGMKALVKAHDQDLIRDYKQSSETVGVISTVVKRLLSVIKH